MRCPPRRTTGGGTGGGCMRSPDVVLLDIAMPGDSDGFDVCRRLRSDPATGLLSVVIVTGLSARTECARIVKAGADDVREWQSLAKM